MSLIDRRIALLLLFFGCCLTAATVRAAWLGTVKSDKLKQAAATQQAATVVIPARRGEIFDRSGVALANSERAADVIANPMLIKDPLSVAKQLADVLDEDQEDLLPLLTKRGSGFEYLVRKAPWSQVQRIQQLHIEGVDTVETSRRVYPQGMLAGQVLGSVGVDGAGLAGLEYRYERQLHGVDGKRRTVRDARSKPLSVQDLRVTQSGRSIDTTLDSDIQLATEEVLDQVGRTFKAKDATAVVANPKTGEVLAMANWPRVDPNHFGNSKSQLNRATGFTYEPGSTFKAFTVAGALEDHAVTPQTSFTLPPQIQVADRVIGESHARGWLTLNIGQILAQSSNVGTIKIAQSLGERGLDKWIHRFGFGKPTGVGGPTEEIGIVPRRQKWSGSSIANLPIGQGLSITVAQLVSAYSAIANNGVKVPLRLIEKLGGKPVNYPRPKRVLSPATAATVRQMLTGVFQAGGTASEVTVPGYELAGKTGTANKVDPATGTYSKTRYVASFVGMAPAKNPGVVIAVVVDEPQSESIYGGEVAAPAFGKIASAVLPRLGIAPQ